MLKIPENIDRFLHYVETSAEEKTLKANQRVKEFGLFLNNSDLCNIKKNMVLGILKSNLIKYIRGENDEYAYESLIVGEFSMLLHGFIQSGSLTSNNEDLVEFLLYGINRLGNIDYNKPATDYLQILYRFFSVIYDVYSNNFMFEVQKLINGDFKTVEDWINDHHDFMYEYFNEITKDNKKYEVPIKTIISHIIENDKYDEEDIFIAANALEIMDFDNKLISIFKKTLLKRYKERIKPKDKKVSIKVGIKQEIKKTPNVITDKEYRSILKEIRKYFNPYTVQLTVEEISEEERNHVFSLMVKIDLDKDVIVRFMRLTEKEEKHTYAYFKDHIDEFSYYYQEYMETLLDYYNELKNCLDEEKEFWINAINDVIDKIRYDGKLDSYEYEIRKLKGSN